MTALQKIETLNLGKRILEQRERLSFFGLTFIGLADIG